MTTIEVLEKVKTECQKRVDELIGTKADHYIMVRNSGIEVCIGIIDKEIEFQKQQTLEV